MRNIDRLAQSLRRPRWRLAAAPVGVAATAGIVVALVVGCGSSTDNPIDLPSPGASVTLPTSLPSGFPTSLPSNLKLPSDLPSGFPTSLPSDLDLPTGLLNSLGVNS